MTHSLLVLQQDLGIFEAAFESVMTFLHGKGQPVSVTISMMTKVMLDEDVLAMGLSADVTERLRNALENTLREVLLEVCVCHLIIIVVCVVILYSSVSIWCERQNQYAFRLRFD